VRFPLLRYGEPTCRARTITRENIMGLRDGPMLSAPDDLTKILEKI
jgi:hypothetical protein